MALITTLRWNLAGACLQLAGGREKGLLCKWQSLSASAAEADFLDCDGKDFSSINRPVVATKEIGNLFKCRARQLSIDGRDSGQVTLWLVGSC